MPVLTPLCASPYAADCGPDANAVSTSTGSTGSVSSITATSEPDNTPPSLALVMSSALGPSVNVKQVGRLCHGAHQPRVWFPGTNSALCL